MTSPPYHLQKPARCGQQIIEVDHQLVEVLEWCWEQGIRTEFSCQGGEEEDGYIMFSTAVDAEAFLASVAMLGEDLAKKAHRVEPYDGKDKKAWQLVAFPMGDCCGEWSDPQCQGPLDTRIRISLRMPNWDMQLIRGRLPALV